MTCPFPVATMNLSLCSIKCTGHHLCKSEKPSEERKMWYEEFTYTKKRGGGGIWTVGKVGKTQGISVLLTALFTSSTGSGLRPCQEFQRR